MCYFWIIWYLQIQLLKNQPWSYWSIVKHASWGSGRTWALPGTLSAGGREPLCGWLPAIQAWNTPIVVDWWHCRVWDRGSGSGPLLVGSLCYMICPSILPPGETCLNGQFESNQERSGKSLSFKRPMHALIDWEREWGFIYNLLEVLCVLLITYFVIY